MASFLGNCGKLRSAWTTHVVVSFCKVPRSFAWIDHRIRSEGILKRLRPEDIGLHLFLTLAADRNGLSCWRLDRIERDIPCFDRHALWNPRDQLVELELIAYRCVVLNPVQTHASFRARIRKTTTDKIDSLGIARLILTGNARPCFAARCTWRRFPYITNTTISTAFIKDTVGEFAATPAPWSSLPTGWPGSSGDC